MSITKSELAELLKIDEIYIHYNNGLWDIIHVDNTWDIIVKSNLVENGKFKVKFGKVKGTFWCSHLGLTSLIGAPYEVTGSFLCYNNNLTTLDYLPKKIGFNLDCSYNNLTHIYIPPNTMVSRTGISSINCSYNKITTLSLNDVYDLKLNEQGYKYTIRSHVRNILSYYNKLVVHNNKISIINDIDANNISLYKNPYHFFRKFNYEYK